MAIGDTERIGQIRQISARTAEMLEEAARLQQEAQGNSCIGARMGSDDSFPKAEIDIVPLPDLDRVGYMGRRIIHAIPSPIGLDDDMTLGQRTAWRLGGLLVDFERESSDPTDQPEKRGPREMDAEEVVAISNYVRGVELAKQKGLEATEPEARMAFLLAIANAKAGVAFDILSPDGAAVIATAAHTSYREQERVPSDLSPAEVRAIEKVTDALRPGEAGWSSLLYPLESDL